jgi:hypothetical protein
MLSRPLLITALISAAVSSAVAFAVARLTAPPSAQASAGQEPPIVRVQGLEIVDSTGTVRGYLGLKQDRNVTLEMFGQSAQEGLSLGLTNFGGPESAPRFHPGLIMNGGSGGAASLVTSPDGSVGLGMWTMNEQMIPRGAVGMDVGPDGAAKIEVRGPSGQPIWKAP